MPGSRVWFNAHAHRQMRERDLSVDDILEVARSGEVIEDYPADYPYPTQLVLGVVRGRTVHVAIALQHELDAIIILTAYEPTLDRWETGFRIRRPR